MLLVEDDSWDFLGMGMGWKCEAERVVTLYEEYIGPAVYICGYAVAAWRDAFIVVYATSRTHNISPPIACPWHDSLSIGIIQEFYEISYACKCMQANPKEKVLADFKFLKSNAASCRDLGTTKLA